jgi:phage terminase large subunit-like protein
MKHRKAHSRRSPRKRAASASSKSSAWSKFKHRVDLYARRVLGDRSAGPKILAGPWVRLQCERHLRDRALAASKSGHHKGWWFSEAAANVSIQFFETVLRLPDSLLDEDDRVYLERIDNDPDDRGREKPFILEPPMAFMIGSIRGWMGADGYRQIREAYIEQGKGNGKTPMIAGLCLEELVIGGEPAAEIYPAAKDRDQARIMFRDCERMVECSPELKPIIKNTVNNLSYGMSFIRPYSRDQGMKSGVRPQLAAFDEVHEQPNAEAINKLKAGFKFRKQPLAVYITNSGFDRTSICFQLHQHAQRVLQGVVDDDRFFAYVCALDEGDDPLTDSTCWGKTNPMLGITITREYLERQVTNAKNIPSEMNLVLRLNFCVWTNQQTRAIDMVKWMACQKVIISDDELRLAPCYGGLDLGQTDDLSAWVLVWVLESCLLVRVRFWIPEVGIDLYPNRPYPEWKRLELLEVTEGNTTDYDTIEEAVGADCERWGVRQVGYDNRFAEQMAQHLMGRGIVMVNTPQGFALNEAIRAILKAVADGTLSHNDNAILTYQASNVVVRHGTKGEIRIDKEKSPEKIDGIAALATAMDAIVRQPPDVPAEDPKVVFW